jgi:SAM-dependent methyltransferase
MDITYLNSIRRAELDVVLARHQKLMAGKSILEIGSGTGVQLEILKKIGTFVRGIDLCDGTYASVADSTVEVYDGHIIPFPDNSFDVVFSSNVLEHIAHREAFQKEIYRVLKADGYCIHVLPNHMWKFWTITATTILVPVRLIKWLALSVRNGKNHFPATREIWRTTLFGEHHGEFGNRVTEIYHFHPNVWEKVFSKCGWLVISKQPTNVFYEGNSIFKRYISIKSRVLLSSFAGSVCTVFLLKKGSGVI